VYALFAAPSTVTSVSGVTDPNWSFLGVYATNTTSASGGRLNGGLVILSPAYAVGSTFSFLVRGWSSSIAGQDWSAAQTFMHNFEADPNASGSAGQLFGASDIAVMQVGGGGLPPQFVFATTPGTSVQGFLLDQVPIPEPSIFALIGLGGATVLIFRRKPRLGPVRKAPAA
jgi:hypothetical protein